MYSNCNFTIVAIMQITALSEIKGNWKCNATLRLNMSTVGSILLFVLYVHDITYGLFRRQLKGHLFR